MSLILTKVSATNLKGPSFSYDMSPFTILCGDNFIGKSRVLDAIVLALLGYHPRLKKTQTFDLASGPHMRVEVELGQNVAVTQTKARRGAKAKASAEPVNLGPVYSVSRDWRLAGKSVSTEANLGCPEELLAKLPMALNIAEYFAKTPGERLNYLFGVVSGGDTFDTGPVVAEVKNIALPDGGNTEATEKIIAECIGVIGRYIGSAREFFDGVIPEFKEMLKLAKATSKERTGMVRTMASLQSVESQLAALDLATLQTQLTAAREASSKANANVATLRERKRAFTDGAAKRKEATAFIEAHAEFKPEDVVKAKNLTDSLGGEADAAQKAADKARAAKDDLTVKYRAAKAELDRCAGRVREITQQIESLTALECCPTCKAKARGWRDTVETAMRGQLSEAEAAFVAEKAKVEQIIAEGKAAGDAAATAQQAASNADKAWREQGAKAQAMATTAAKLEAYRAVLKGTACEDVPESELIAAVQAQTDTGNRVTVLLQKISEAQRLQQDVRRIAQAQKDLAHVDAQVAVYSAVVEKLDDMRTKLIAKAVGTVLEPANQIIGSLMPPLVYEDGEFGYRQGPKLIKSHTFSGAQEALTFMGLSLGLAATCELRVGVLDELARLHPRNIPKFFAAVDAALKSGLLGQFVGVIPMDEAGVYELLSEAGVKAATVIEVR